MAQKLLLKMTLLVLTAIDMAASPTGIITEFIEDFADRWTTFFCNAVIADIDEEFLNGNMIKKLVDAKSHAELNDLIAMVQRNHLKLAQTTEPVDQLEAVLTVLDNIIDNHPGWAEDLRKLKTHVQNQYRARYTTRTGLNTLSNIILLATYEPGKLLQIYPWLVSHPATRKRIRNSNLYRRLNRDHFTSLINEPAENTLTINMARVCELGEERGIPDLTLFEILKPKIFENTTFEDEDPAPARNRDIRSNRVSSGDMMVVTTAERLQNLAMSTINSGK